MAWGKSGADDQQKSSAERSSASPSAKAVAAYKNGDRFFQLQLSVGVVAWGQISLPQSGVQVAENTAALLGEIEAAGWQLEHMGFVFAPTLEHPDHRMSGEIMGFYLFGRVDRAIDRPSTP